MLKVISGSPLLDLYSQCASSRDLRALYGVYGDLLSAQATALIHLRQLGHGAAVGALAGLLEAAEAFAVHHLKSEIAKSELEDEPA